MEGIKRALRKLFGGGKKDKQEEVGSRNAATPRATLNKASPQQQQQRQSVAAAGSSPGMAKALPPSHPLATGQQQSAQRAVPRSDGARVANSASDSKGGAVGGLEGMNGQQDRDAHNVSPPAPSDSIAPEGEGRSQRVSEVEELDRDSLPPPPPPKSDVEEQPHKVREAPEEDAGLATIADHAVTTNHVATSASPAHHTTLAGARLDPASAPKEQTLSNSDSAQHDQSAIEETSTTARPPSSRRNGSVGAPQPIISDPSIDEGKILVMDEEPPQIKPVRMQPGMSATSGPLEDFPEGGPFP